MVQKDTGLFAGGVGKIPLGSSGSRIYMHVDAAFVFLF